MKKIILSTFAFFFTTTIAFSQLNNSWIDYSKTYYKFPLAKDTLCRINQPVLVAAGLGAVPAENFQLWRNGKQVRIYTSLATGVLGASDYIEFWGEMNDGKPDNNLYRNPASQLSEKFSSFFDEIENTSKAQDACKTWLKKKMNNEKGNYKNRYTDGRLANAR